MNSAAELDARHNAGWLVALVCIAGPALVALIPMAAAPALMSMARHFAVGADAQLFSQFVMTLPAAMLVVAAPIAGVLASRIGQRAILLGSLTLYVIGGAGVLAIDSKQALIGLRLILGIAGGGLLTSCLGLIGDHFSGHARERLLGYATALSSLFAAAALIFGGRMVDFGGWQAPFTLYFLGIPTLVMAAAVIRDVRIPSPGSRRINVRGELGHVWMYYALLVLLTLAMFTPSIQAPFVLEAKGIGSAQMVGSIVAASSIVAIFSAGAFGALRRVIGLHGFLVLDTLAMGAGILAIGLANEVWQIFAGCALVGIGAGMSEPAIASIIFHRAAPIAHAVAMGLIVSALNAGQFVNPLIFAPLRDHFGAPRSFIVVGVLLLAVSAFIAVRNRADLVEKGLIEP
ncbi:MAG: MFS transporter [Novosphingobium sp.]